MRVVVDVGYWIHEYALSLREGENDGVVLTGKNSGLLAIHDADCLVPILRKDDFHVFVWKDGVRLHHRSTRDVADGASWEEMANDDLVNSLCRFPGHGHYGGVAVLLIGMPDVFIRQFSLRAQDFPCLHFVHLLLARKHETYEVEKFRVLWVDDAKLLIEGVDDCV